MRIAHLGLGAFHRAHQAWFTDVSDPANEWGIRAFTGRSPHAATALAAQDGLYTVIERSESGDRFSLIDAISDAVDGARMDVFAATLAAPQTTLLTLTITEPGYMLDAAGSLALGNPAVGEDVEWLRTHLGGARVDLASAPRTALGRILVGLDARRRASSGPFTVVPCDNLPGSGALTKAAILTLADRAGLADLAEYVSGEVDFVATSVDRITPRATEDDRATVATATGWIDSAPVVTEPFTNWVLSDNLRCDRPQWERAGAVITTDVEPFERRKLWLLNGSHSLMAYAGMLHGKATVAEAIADPVIASWVDEYWDEACRHLPNEGLDLEQYRAALRERYANSRIRHLLAQIGQDGVMKLGVRIAPVLKAERVAGRDGTGSIRALGAWVAMARAGELPNDRAQDQVRAAAEASGEESVRALLGLIDAELAEAPEVVAAVARAAGSFA